MIISHQKIIELNVAVNYITAMEEVEDFHDLVNINTKNLGGKAALNTIAQQTTVGATAF